MAEILANRCGDVGAISNTVNISWIVGTDFPFHVRAQFIHRLASSDGVEFTGSITMAVVAADNKDILARIGNEYFLGLLSETNRTMVKAKLFFESL